MLLRQIMKTRISALEDESCSLPSLIQVAQYSRTATFRDITGTFGKREFPFSFEIPQNTEDFEVDENFQSITKMLTNLKNPSLSKKFLFKKFDVFEIPDYGNQSFSAGFLDFVPFCFDKDGYKIFQKNVGILRYYPQKKAFILIPKNILLTSEKKISILIQFKIKDLDSTREFNLNISNGKFEKIFNGENGGDVKFLASLMEDDIGHYANNLSEPQFEIYDRDYNRIDNSCFLMKTELKNDNPNEKVNKQSAYFSSLYKETFFDTHNLEKDFKYTLTLTPLIKGLNRIKITTKQNLSSVYIFRKEDNFVNISSINMKDPKQFELFGFANGSEKEGKKLIYGMDFFVNSGTSLENKFISKLELYSDSAKGLSVFEVIPYTDRKRKTRLITKSEIESSDELSFSKYLKDNFIKDYNISLKDADISIFSDGALKDFEINNANNTIKNLETSENSLTEIIVRDAGILSSADIGEENYPDLEDKFEFNNWSQFNKYSFFGDPYRNYEYLSDEDISFFETQEVFLLDKDTLEDTLEFKKDSESIIVEPYIESSSSEIQGFSETDISNIENSIKGKINAFNSFFSGNSAKIRKIEEDSSELKANFIEIAKKSSSSNQTIKDVTDLNFSFIYIDLSDKLPENVTEFESIDYIFTINSEKKIRIRGLIPTDDNEIVIESPVFHSEYDINNLTENLTFSLDLFCNYKINDEESTKKIEAKDVSGFIFR